MKIQSNPSGHDAEKWLLTCSDVNAHQISKQYKIHKDFCRRHNNQTRTCSTSLHFIKGKMEKEEEEEKEKEEVAEEEQEEEK